jgi:hypothetical protein
MTAFAAKNVKVASMRIAFQSFLNLDRQAVHAASHVGVADRQPHSHTRWNRDHRRANASTTAAAKAATLMPGSERGHCPQIRSRSWASAAVRECHRSPAPSAPEQSRGRRLQIPPLASLECRHVT